MTSAIEYEAYRHNYILKCSFYGEELTKESFHTAIKSNDIKGLVVLGRFNEDALKSIVETQENVVFVGLNYISEKHDTVFCDGYRAGRKAMEALFGYGHSDVVYIGETEKENRYLSYCDAMKEEGYSVKPSSIVATKQTLSGGYEAVQQLMKRNETFTAIFCANDATAIGAIKALKEQKIKVPDDVSVISIDDIEMSRYFTPMLTTVHIPIAELGRHAAKSLIDRIEKGHRLPIRIELPISLSMRDSCKEKKK